MKKKKCFKNLFLLSFLLQCFFFLFLWPFLFRFYSNLTHRTSIIDCFSTHPTLIASKFQMIKRKLTKEKLSAKISWDVRIVISTIRFFSNKSLLSYVLEPNLFTFIWRWQQSPWTLRNFWPSVFWLWRIWLWQRLMAIQR